MSDDGTGKTIVLVGHCRPDEFMLKSAISSLLPGARVEAAGDERTVGVLAASADLLLINRVLDGAFESDDGHALLTRWVPTVATMLVSNLAPAQQRSFEAGAALGFGKSELRSEAMRSALRSALGL